MFKRNRLKNAIKIFIKILLIIGASNSFSLITFYIHKKLQRDSF